MREYVAFISYRHVPLDEDVAKYLQYLIESYTIPHALRKNNQKKLGTVFRDQDELAASSDLSQEIRNALDHSKFLIVLCSPESFNSIWVGREITYFLKNHSRQNVLTVLVSGTPEEAFHPLVAYTNNTEKLEPLAVDIRANTKRKTLRKLHRESRRLFAALLQCPYDSLVLREQRQMIKRAAITFCSGFLVVVGIGALILFQNYQITRQNMELKQQRNELWYSESQLLTLDAEEALDAGNFYLAIQKAVDALPNSELPERPYYAPAEAVLFDALDLFETHKDRAAYYDVVLEQSTAVEDIFISEDGCKAVTIDQYGVLNCFDTASGILQWSKYIPGSDKSGEWILPCGDPSRIACLYRGNLECRDLNTGELIWEYTLEHAFPDCLFYDSQNDVWLCIPYETDLNLDITSISFQTISGKTGAVLRNIPFPQEDDISCCFFTNLYFPYGEPLFSGGAFSPDGRYFAGIYGEHHYESESWILKCCLVDIETGVSEICYEGIVEGLYDPAQIGKIEFTDESTALSFVYYTESEINIVKLDVDKKIKIWDHEFPIQAGWVGSHIFAEFWEKSVFVAFEKQLFCVSAETGGLIDETEMPSSITEFKQVSNNSIAILLDDGTYAVGWKNPSGLHVSTDSGIASSTTIGQYRNAEIYGGGLLQFYSDETEAEISISNRVSAGYIAFSPIQNENEVIIRRPSPVFPRLESETLLLPDGITDGIHAEVVFFNEDSMMIGPFEDGGKLCYLNVDLISQTVKKTISIDHVNSINSSYYGMKSYPLPDGSGLIWYSDDGTVFLQNDGSIEQLSLKKDYILLDDGSRCYANIEICGTTYLPLTGEVVTCKLGEDYLQLWKNGKQELKLPLPDKLIFRGDCDSSGQRHMKIYSNGLVFISGCDTDNLNDAYLYDILNECWIKLTADVSMPNAETITLSQSAPICVAVDGRDMVWVKNYITGETISSLALRTPNNAVSQMKLILDDTCLLVATNDAYLQIYSIDTGETLFTVKFSDYSSKIETMLDENNQRMYIVCGKECVCLDLRSWTQLVEIEDCLLFDAANKLIYQISWRGNITFAKVPGSAELISMGRSMIQ